MERNTAMDRRFKNEPYCRKAWYAAMAGKDYSFQFQREIIAVKGSNIIIDNPVVMEIDAKYCSAFVYRYDFKGRIQNVGVENIDCESAYTADTSENHSWDAISVDKAENSWIRNINARYFAFSCVNLGRLTKIFRCLTVRALITNQ